VEVDLILIHQPVQEEQVVVEQEQLEVEIQLELQEQLTLVVVGVVDQVLQEMAEPAVQESLS
jgi:hypothetical protein